LSALKHDMVDAQTRKFVTGCQTSLTSTNNCDLDLLHDCLRERLSQLRI
jgi:hypothetical protein